MTSEEELMILKRLEKLELGIARIESLALSPIKKNRRIKKVLTKKNY